MYVKLSWLKEGKRKVLHRWDEGLWQAFSVGNYELYEVDNYRHNDVLMLETKSEDEVFIQRSCHKDVRVSLVQRIREIIPKMKKIDFWKHYNGMRIPNIKLDRTFDDDSLNGMWFKKNGVKRRVNQSINKIKLDMDYKGVEVKSIYVSGIGTYSNAPIRPEFKVDGPFLMWIHRKGMELPYFIGRITEQDWEEIDW